MRAEEAERLGEGHRHRGDEAGVDREEQRPPVEEAEQWRERLGEEDVLAARAGHGRRELGVGERSGEGEEAAQDPEPEQEPGSAGSPP